MPLVYILFLAFSYLTPDMDQGKCIQVMTYNLRLPLKSDGMHYWDIRRPLLTSLLRYHEVDLLGVQEAFRRQLDEITSDLPEYGWFGVCRTDGSIDPNPDGEFSAILYRKSRFKLIEGNTFWLSETPDKVGSVGWDAALPRIVTWAKFKDIETGKIFYHFNTHFDHRGEKARNESAKLILQKIKSIAGKTPTLLTGDFNCGESEQPYQTITTDSSSLHLLDAMMISQTPHYGPTASFAADFQASGLIDHRIDFIFVTPGIKVLKHAILSDSWKGNLASDHLPVLAQVRM